MTYISVEDDSILHKIFLYGGYTTVNSLTNIMKSYDSAYYLLNRFCDYGYLKKQNFYSDNRNKMQIYQVTKKACRRFGNPESHFRKKHTDTYIVRALIKQQLFFELCRLFENEIIAEHKDRINILCNETGYTEDDLPYKVNNKTKMVHVEEYLLDLRNNEGKELFCPASKTLLFDKSYKGIIVVYIDKSQVNPYAQIITLLQRYKNIINKDLGRINFLIVTDTDRRENIYRSIIERSFPESLCNVEEGIIQIHSHILEHNFGVDRRILLRLPDEVKAKFNGTCFVTESDYEGIPLEDIKKNGIKEIHKFALSLINPQKSQQENSKTIKDFFTKIYKLSVAGKLKSVPFYGTVYRVGIKFSIF